MNSTTILSDMREEERVRVRLFAQRRANNEVSLQKDVDAILRSLPADTLIYHHVQQFSIFWPEMYKCLKQAYNRLPNAGQADDDREAFLALAIGGITAQWSILRAVAFQRMPGSPYLETLKTLDERTHALYERVLQALPGVNRPIWQRLSSSYPLVYIGDVANMRLFGDAPAVVSLMFGALYPDTSALTSDVDYWQYSKWTNGNRVEHGRSALAISHELGHIVCARMPDLLEHLKQQLMNKFEAELKVGTGRKLAILLDIAMGWLEEIVADLFGVALEGPVFVRSALLNGVLPDGSLTRGDREHPPTVIRLWIQFKLLEYLAANDEAYNSRYGREIAALRRELKQQTDEIMHSRFDQVPAVMSVSLGGVHELALRLVDELLKTKLGAHRRHSLGDVFLGCVGPAPKAAAVRRRAPWGKQAIKEICDDPVLEFLRIEFDQPLIFCPVLDAMGIKCQ